MVRLKLYFFFEVMNCSNCDIFFEPNQIVEMRKCVRQSRIHSIHKLSREIKKLKEKKGTDEQKIKNLKKAERFVEEIGIMKVSTYSQLMNF